MGFLLVVSTCILIHSNKNAHTASYLHPPFFPSQDAVLCLFVSLLIFFSIITVLCCSKHPALSWFTPKPNSFSGCLIFTRHPAKREFHPSQFLGYLELPFQVILINSHNIWEVHFLGVSRGMTQISAYFKGDGEAHANLIYKDPFFQSWNIPVFECPIVTRFSVRILSLPLIHPPSLPLSLPLPQKERSCPQVGQLYPSKRMVFA